MARSKGQSQQYTAKGGQLHATFTRGYIINLLLLLRVLLVVLSLLLLLLLLLQLWLRLLLLLILLLLQMLLPLLQLYQLLLASVYQLPRTLPTLQFTVQCSTPTTITTEHLQAAPYPCLKATIWPHAVASRACTLSRARSLNVS